MINSKCFLVLLTTVALSIIPGAAHAQSQPDGIYQCKINIIPLSLLLDAFLSVHTADNGHAVFVSANPFANNIHGYSMGRIIGSNYSGVNGYGDQVNFNIEIADQKITGAEVFYLNNQRLSAHYSCSKIF